MLHIRYGHGKILPSIYRRDTLRSTKGNTSSSEGCLHYLFGNTVIFDTGIAFVVRVKCYVNCAPLVPTAFLEKKPSLLPRTVHVCVYIDPILLSKHLLKKTCADVRPQQHPLS